MSWTCKGCGDVLLSLNLLHCSSCHTSHLGDEAFTLHRKSCRAKLLAEWRKLAQEAEYEKERQRENPAA